MDRSLKGVVGESILWLGSFGFLDLGKRLTVN
jgi:hypothetical protein